MRLFCVFPFFFFKRKKKRNTFLNFKRKKNYYGMKKMMKELQKYKVGKNICAL